MKIRFGAILTAVSVIVGAQVALAEPAEISCNIRESGGSMSCQWVSKERKSMSPEDIPLFIDEAQVAAYITLKSRKGLERTYFVDGQSAQFKRLMDLKKTASISEINKAKSDLFSEIEKKTIKLSDELDGQAAAAELVKYDSSITNDKFRREMRNMTMELDGFKKNRDKVCTSTPAFEQMSKANASLQQTLSNILYAFQTPDSCMSDFKIFKDKDGTVDLRQLDSVAQKFNAQCKKK